MRGHREALEALMARYLRVLVEDLGPDETPIASLEAADWHIIDLAIAVETTFGFPLSADQALAHRTVGDWRNLMRRETAADQE
jgi:hypothetical protein